MLYLQKVQSWALCASKFPLCQGWQEQSAGREGNVTETSCPAFFRSWTPVLERCSCSAWAKRALSNSLFRLKTQGYHQKLILVLPAAQPKQFCGATVFVFANSADHPLQSWKHLCKPISLWNNCTPDSGNILTWIWVSSDDTKPSSPLFNKSLPPSSADTMQEMSFLLYKHPGFYFLSCVKSWKTTFCHCPTKRWDRAWTTPGCIFYGTALTLPAVFPHFQATKWVLNCCFPKLWCWAALQAAWKSAPELPMPSAGAELNLRAAPCSAMQTCPRAGCRSCRNPFSSLSVLLASLMGHFCF